MNFKTGMIAIFIAVIAMSVLGQANCNAWNTSKFTLTASPNDVRRCLDASADIDARDKDGLTPLHRAAQLGTAEIINMLLDAGADIESRTETGTTPLHYAAYRTDKNALNVLLETGANIEARTKKGYTPLHYAAGWGTEEILNALLDAGANPKVQNLDKNTPFDMAKKNDRLQNTKGYWRLNDARFD